MIRPSNKLLWLLLPLLALSFPQARAACTNTLSTTSRIHGYGSASNVVSLATSSDCAWTIENSNNWITFTTPASGSGSFTNIYSVTANPNPVWRTGVVVIADQLFTIRQNPFPCTSSISPDTRTHGYTFTTGTVNVATAGVCPWTLQSTSTWINILSGTNGLGNATVTYTVNDNLSALWRTSVVMVATQSYTVIQRALACPHEISPVSRVLSQGAATGLIGVTATPDCHWTASNPNSWITITSGGSGTGDGSVFYSVIANPSGLARTGLVMIADQTFTLTQLGMQCAYAISPSNQTHGAGSATGLVTVTATPGCSWATVNTNSWIVLTAATSGTGSGSVAYSVAINPGSSTRTGVVVIAGRTLTIVQPGLGCSFKLSPTNRVHGYAAVADSVKLTTSNGCPWNVINTNSWVTIISGESGSGSNLVHYTIEPNTTPPDRTGVVLIGGQALTLTQHGIACEYSLSPSNRAHGFGSASNFISVSTSSGCPWTVVNTNSWITVVTGAGGTGDGPVGYLVAANPDAAERVGILAIGGQSLVLTQRAATCSYAIAPVGATHGASADSGLVAVSAVGGCGWTASSSDAWITITSGASGVGNGNVTYALAANSSPSPRTGALLIAGALFTVTQSEWVCVYKLTPTSRNRIHGSGAAANFISLTASNECAWTVVNTNGWVVITSAMSGSGSASITYTVDSNPDIEDRMGFVVIGGQPFSLIQRGIGCDVSTSPATRNHGNGAASNVVNVTALTNCAWAATVTNDWLAIVLNSTGMGTGTVGYTVAPNPSSIPRNGAVLVGDQALVITQSGASCTYSITPISTAHDAGMETGLVSVTAVSGCSWGVTNTTEWITILTGSNGVGSGSVTYSVTVNSSMNSRTGLVMIADDLFTVTQAGLPVVCSYRASPTNRTHGYGAAVNSADLITEGGCAWTVVNTNDWIQITSPLAGTSAATVDYTVEPNPNLDDRMGVILMGGQPFTITQRGLACTYDISPSSRGHGAGAATNTVSVSTGSTCAWEVSSTNDWISISSGPGGTGDGAVTYILSPNSSPVARIGSLSIDGLFFTITQAATTCTFRLSPTNRTHGFSSATGTVSVTAGAGCAWTVSASENWITILSGASGNGNGSFTYTVPGNFNPTQRTGLVMVADQALTLVQRAATNGFAIETIVMQPVGQSKLRLAGAPAGVWRVQGSSNLVNWIDVSSITNITGVVEYIDTAATNANIRFYRAVQP